MRHRVLILAVVLCSCGNPEPPSPAPSLPRPPAVAEPSRVETVRPSPTAAVRLTGSPEALGTQHGQQLTDEIKIMLREHVKYDLGALLLR